MFEPMKITNTKNLTEYIYDLEKGQKNGQLRSFYLEILEELVHLQCRDVGLARRFL